MTTFIGALRSSLGKKYLMGFTGLVWVGFAIGHLIGNLLLLVGREAFNGYALFLETLGHGAAIYVAEAFLLVTIGIHVWNGISVALVDKSAARPIGYQVTGNAGGRSRKGAASQGMIWTGLTILAFLVFHLITFKFAYLFGHVENYTLNGEEHVDLYGVVVERFSQAWYVGIYTAVMLLFGMHLKHGVWSAFQSLGLLNKKTTPLAVNAALALAVLLTIGFLFLPVTIFAMNESFAAPAGGLHL